MSTRKKKKNGLVYLLLLIVLVLCIFIFLGIKQQKDALAARPMAGKAEPWEFDVCIFGKDF